MVNPSNADELWVPNNRLFSSVATDNQFPYNVYGNSQNILTYKVPAVSTGIHHFSYQNMIPARFTLLAKWYSDQPMIEDMTRISDNHDCQNQHGGNFFDIQHFLRVFPAISCENSHGTYVP